jgi:two-component system sensor histidine kinase CpxA
MKLRFPLYAKILCWFFLNVVFLCAVFLAVGRGQFHFGLDALISGPAGERFQKVTQLLTAELRDRPQTNWTGVLKQFSDTYNVQFYLFRNGEQLAGETVKLPDEVRERVNERRGFGPPSRHQPGPPDEADRPPNEDRRPPDEFAPPPPHDLSRDSTPSGPLENHRFMIHTASPGRYWVVTHFVIPDAARRARPEPMALVAASESMSGGGLFFDLTSWIMAGVAVVVISVLFWFPLVRGITRSISRMTDATEKIAEGHFEVRAQVQRNDELGLLSDAINRMAMRLSGFVAGQKRFLGDIAHELCSPIARIQVALAILEQRADEKQKSQLQDLREEVEQMSNLVNELLSFTKASMGGATVKLQTVSVKTILEKAVARECALGGGTEVKLEVAEDLQIKGDADLLLRAFGNILRNAIHYAGQAGPITITALREETQVRVNFEDCGPGIPEAAIAQVFDPFYRVDVSRARETGGVGLGLAIVKTCVESCGGTVRCENRAEGGLRVVTQFIAAE